MGERTRKTLLAGMAKSFEGWGIRRIHLSYKSGVQTIREPCRSSGIQVFGTTWSAEHMGYTPELKDIQDKVKDHMDQFISAYLSVNRRGD